MRRSRQQQTTKYPLQLALEQTQLLPECGSLRLAFGLLVLQLLLCALSGRWLSVRASVHTLTQLSVGCHASTSSRLAVLTRTGGKHTLQRPKLQLAMESARATHGFGFSDGDDAADGHEVSPRPKLHALKIMRPETFYSIHNKNNRSK